MTIGKTRSGALGGALSILLLAAMLCLYAAPAQALKTHRLIAKYPVPGHLPIASAVAVNETTGHIYVTATPFDFGTVGGSADPINLNPDGSPSAVSPRLPIPPNFVAESLAVDNSNGSSDGNIWVNAQLYYRNDDPTDPFEAQVIQFSPTGTPTGIVISQADIPPDGTAQGEGLPPVVNPPSGSSQTSEMTLPALAVRANGDVLVLSTIRVTDSAKDEAEVIEVINEFSPAGAFVRQIGKAAGEAWPYPLTRVAVAPDGTIAVGGSGGVMALSEDGDCLNACAPLVAGSIESLAFDDQGHLLASPYIAHELREYNLDGEVLSSTSTGLIENRGVAVDGSRERLYVAGLTFFENGGNVASAVEAYGPRVTVPDVTTGPPTQVEGSMVEVSGEINPDGGPEATCEFQYVDQKTFEGTGFNNARTAACVPDGPFTGEATVAVSGELSSLNGGTTYRYRLVGSNADGTNAGSAVTVQTLGPTVRSEFVTEVSGAGARLNATINPNGDPTEYHFQYVDKSSFEAHGWLEASEVPAGGVAIPAGTEDVDVSTAIQGLDSGTEYRYRVIASNSAPGVATGEDASLVTIPPLISGLPDDRAYELVSPTNKNGASIQGETNAMHAAADGSAVTFFSNGGIPGGEGAQGFPSYVASRAADGSGWSTQGLLPPASTGPNGTVIGWNESLSNVYLGNIQPEKSATVLQRSVPSRTVTAIAEGGKAKGEFKYAGESEDGNAVLLEGLAAALTPGAVAGKHNAYLLDRASNKIVLAGVLNNGSAPEGGSYAGPFDWFLSPGKLSSGNPTSTHGGAATYSVVAEHTLSDQAQGVFFTSVATSQVYLRRNPTKSQSPMSGETCLEPDTAACTIQISSPNPGVVDPHGPKPAAFIGATADGSSALILSSAKLTADATTGDLDEGSDLYRYDVATDQLTDLTVDPDAANGAEVQGVLGTSADGSRIYIAANGVLAPGATPGNCGIGSPSGSCNIYLLEGGHAVFVARVEPGRYELAGLKKAPDGVRESDIINWNPTSSAPGTGGASGLGPVSARVSRDGSALLFRSDARVTSYDNDEYAQLYRYEIGAGVTCVSCKPTQEAPDAPSSLQGFPPERFTGVKFEFSTITRNLSKDGKRVFFATAQSLLPQDTNGVVDVYEWEAPDSGDPSSSCDSDGAVQNGGCLYLISSGTSPQPSYFADADEDGSNAFILTTDQLVLQDRDELGDVYDARVGGGIPSQNAEPPPPCQGEQCVGPAAGAPPSAAIGSSSAVAGNTPKFICDSGFRKVKKKGKVRCERKKPPPKKRRHGHSKKRSDRGGNAKGGKR